MDNLNQHIRIIPALENNFRRTSSLFSGGGEEKQGRVLVGLLRLVILALLMFFVLTAGATASAQDGKRSSVGVVLSGGGAKGLAHIGVLKALEEYEVPIDFIAGTSIGAIIGGMYAAGFSPLEIEEIVHSEAFRNASTGHISEEYTYFFFEQDPDPAWFSLHYGWEDRLEPQNVLRQNFPSNIVSPFLMDFLFMEFLSPASAAAGNDFDELLIPFRCVATDIEGRKAVIFRNGNLADAIRASMTFPFYFQPITVDGKLMMDGGMYNNFPADILYEDFHPDVMIGCVVSENPEPPTRDDVVLQLQNLLQHPSSYELPSGRSVLIEPDVPQISVTDFSHSQSLIKLGYEATIGKMEEIHASINGRMPVDHLKKKRDAFREEKPEPVVQDVSIDGLEIGTLEYVMKLLKDEPGPITLDQMKERYLMMLSHNRFDYVYPRLMLDPETGYFDFCLEMEKSREFYRSIGGNVSSQNINHLFSRFQFQKLQRNPISLASNIYLGNFYNSGTLSARIDFPRSIPFYMNVYGAYSRWKFTDNTLFFFEEQKPSFLSQRETLLELRGGVAVGNHGKFEMGGFWADLKDQYYNTALFTRSDTMDMTGFSPLVAFFTYETNTLNRKQYANKGTFFNLTLRYVSGKETHRPGSTSLIDRRSQTRHSWMELSLNYKNYFLPGSRFNPGFVTELFLSNRPVFANYASSMIMAKQFNPFPLATTRFLPEFRANHYLAAGFKSIYSLTRTANLQAEAYFFQPLRFISPGVMQEAFYRTFSNDARIIGNLAFVYHTPPGPLSISYSYFYGQEDPWVLMINFGYILFNRQAFM
ncbi:MAG: patatin-like phospholipase family protein [Bacteroidales bacterium]